MTKEPYYVFNIRSRWHGRIEMPDAIGAKFLDMLDALSRIGPIFSNWLIADHPNPSFGDETADLLNIKVVSLASARARIAEIIENNVVRNDGCEPDPDAGYHAIAATGELDGPRVAAVRVNAGGERDGGTDLEFGCDREPPDFTIVTYPLYKAVLLAINAVWRTPWSCAYAYRSGSISVPIEFAPGVVATQIKGVTQVPLDPTFPRSIFHIPWIAYLSAEYATSITAPRDVLTERTPDGGFLMSATTERLDPMNPEHARRARLIAEVMIARFDASSGEALPASAPQ
jgi:hypothetical protein